jgi:hypothetical protein
MGRSLLGMFGQPALGRCPFAVLVSMPVLGHAVLRGQGHDLRVPGAAEHWGDGGMVIEWLAMGELTGEAVLAMDGWRRKGVGAIQSHQQLMAKAPKRPPQAVLLEALKDLNQDRLECHWGDRIKPRAALIIAGNLLHANQGVDVIVSLGVLEGALVVQK